MSKFLANTSFAELVPESIRYDEQIQAILEAFQPELTKNIANIAKLMLYSRLFDREVISQNASPVLQRLAQMGTYKELEESLLDELAWQFHVDDYDIAKTYEAKLAMVKASIQIHRKKGTKWAVIKAVEASLPDTELRIKEWFEKDYDKIKKPYHFKAELMILGQEVLEDHIHLAKRVIENTKSLRSHCDGITISIGTYGQMEYASYLGLANSITIEPELVTEIELLQEYEEKPFSQLQNTLHIFPSTEDPPPPIILQHTERLKQVYQEVKIIVIYPEKE